jgi:hypothetical protein
MSCTYRRTDLKVGHYTRIGQYKTEHADHLDLSALGDLSGLEV